MGRNRHNGEFTGAVQAAAATVLWAAVVAGFVFYLANFDSFDQTFGSAGAAAVSVLWLALFCTLYFAMPSIRWTLDDVRAPVDPRGGSPEGAELERVARVALADETAHRNMWSTLPGGPDVAPSVLSPIECDLNDWGFTYGVAWAAAKSRYPLESDERIAQRALAAAQAVFSDYCAGEEWSERLDHRRRAHEASGHR
jgi:hypothetical protein